MYGIGEGRAGERMERAENGIGEGRAGERMAKAPVYRIGDMRLGERTSR